MEYLNLEYFFNLEKEGKMAVLDFCMRMGLIASSYECPNCKRPMKLISRKDISDGFYWSCKVFRTENRHRIGRSIRAGSWFERSSLSLTQILKLTYLWITKTSHDFIINELKLSGHTVTEWVKFCRQVCVEANLKNNIFLGGPGKIIEIDARQFSGKQSMRKKKASEKWVFGGVERGTNKCFLEIIQKGDKDEILNIMRKYVMPGTTIVSDSWKGYDCLKGEGFVHLKVKHSVPIKHSKTGEHRNTIQGMWSYMKNKLHITKLCKDQLDTYLAEFMWRRFHQGKTQDLLRSFLKSISEIYVPRIKDNPTLYTKKPDKEKRVIVESIEIKIEAPTSIVEDQFEEEIEPITCKIENQCEEEIEPITCKIENQCEEEDETDGPNKRIKY